MGSIPLPALAIKPPEQPDILGNYGKLSALKSAALQQQQQQQQIQENQYQIGARQATNQAYQNAVKIDENGQPKFDTDALTQHLSAAGYGSAIPGILHGITEYEKLSAETKETQQKLATTSKDAMGYIGHAIQQAKYDPKLAHTFIQHGLQDPNLQPQAKQQLQQMDQAIDQNPELVKQFADSAVASSPKIQEMLNQQQVAQIRASKPPEGELPLGDKVPALNQMLTQRWQVSHPGQALPQPYALPQDATQKDFDRVDKMLQSTEQAGSNKAQQDISNAIRQQMISIAQQGLDLRKDLASQREEKVGTKWMMWKDGNRIVAGPESEGKGKEGLADLPTTEIKDVINARNTANLIEKQGDPAKPETQGVLQLIDSLDKDGKLGILASRYNSFMTKGVGAMPNDDPRIITLINKNMLSDTSAMLAHFGASGGRSPLMLKHFEDLANAGKMDAATLKAGNKAIADYMHDKGMMPETKTQQQAAPSSGKQVSLAAAKQLPQNKGKSDDEIRKDIESYGHTVVP